MLTQAKDKLLFTPGPLTTSRAVKEAMLRDLGSRDFEFIRTVREIRRELLDVAGADPETFTAVLMQGSGTFSVEAVLSSTIPPVGELLVAANGAYGRRMAEITRTLRIKTHLVSGPENRKPSLEAIESLLREEPGITHLAVVHCETTTGIVNPIREIGALARRHGKRHIVDAMSSFGALPIDLEDCAVDYLVSSANKCVEGVPGFGFVLSRLSSLRETAGWARSVSLDLHAQWKGLERDGQFRFTPPTHALLAFRQALAELKEEGGVPGRNARYRNNHETLLAGMRGLGFEEYLPREDQGPIITSFRYPKHPEFNFAALYARLNDKGLVIYPGKVSDADCFRIGTIGRIFPEDVETLLARVREALEEMKISLKDFEEER